MTIATREQEILRIQNASFQSELNQELEKKLQEKVIRVVQTVLEAALIEEVKMHIKELGNQSPRRSGYFRRSLNTRFGRIEALAVPKLRRGNKERKWRILTRYQRCRDYLLDTASYLYVMGLSIRDLQEALYLLLGHVLSRSSVNQVTTRIQAQMQQEQGEKIEKTPPVLIIDGVWVSIQYDLEQFKVDRAGHQRRVRQAEERVILAAMAVWPDGTYHILHYEVAAAEDEEHWRAFFDHLIERGLDSEAVQLIVSDGTRGLLPVMAQKLPRAKQQRCIAHKVRGMKRHLRYLDLPTEDKQGNSLTESDAKKLRWCQIAQDALSIYDASSYEEAQEQLKVFVQKWQPLEPKAVHAFQWGLKNTFTFYAFDKVLHVHIRTTNHLERFFREFRTKADEIGAFPNETSCLTLFYLVLIRDHARHDRFL